MPDTIIVRDVVEKNTTDGKKEIYITSMAEDEIASSHFSLTSAWMFPYEKMILACVAPQDEVRVTYNHNFSNNDLMAVGEYIGTGPRFIERDLICKCKTHLISDGFDVYCPNSDCPLTVAARIENLATTIFFPPNMTYYGEETDYRKMMSLSFGSNADPYRPFSMISKGNFWHYPGSSLENILLHRTGILPNLSHFLVDHLFYELLESIAPQDVLDNPQYLGIERLYSYIRDIHIKRDTSSTTQNYHIFHFLKSLGIASLTDGTIQAMMRCEADSEKTLPAFLSYAYMLTHPSELVREIGLFPLEANTIVNEVRRRKYELHDIFYHYTDRDIDVTQCFKDIM